MPTDFKCLGLSSRLVYIVWAVFGGFLYHILLSNYLTILIKPAYNAPIDTAQDVWDRGLTINIIPVGAIWKQFLETSGIPIYNKLAERVVLAKEGFSLKALILISLSLYRMMQISCTRLAMGFTGMGLMFRCRAWAAGRHWTPAWAAGTAVRRPSPARTLTLVICPTSVGR